MAAIQALTAGGVAVKILTGDNERVTRHVCAELGFTVTGLITGDDLRAMSEEALRARLAKVNVFCRVTPQQKERVLLAYKRSGRVVGFLGDGINDASAIHAADVGVSVDSAADPNESVSTSPWCFYPATHARPIFRLDARLALPPRGRVAGNGRALPRPYCPSVVRSAMPGSVLQQRFEQNIMTAELASMRPARFRGDNRGGKRVVFALSDLGFPEHISNIEYVRAGMI